jgi:hypothetical protein
MRKASDTVSPIAANTTVASSLICSSIRARTTAFAGMIQASVQLSHIVAQRFKVINDFFRLGGLIVADVVHAQQAIKT